MTRRVRKRKLTEKDRKQFRKNARRGLRTWEDMTDAQRQSAINKGKASGNPSWGFSGKSPRTRDRRN